jgi:hypothetical protein
MITLCARTCGRIKPVMAKIQKKQRGRRRPIEPERLDDLQVFCRLVALVQELGSLSSCCWSPLAGTSLKTAAELVRAVASAVYRRGLQERE